MKKIKLLGLVLSALFLAGCVLTSSSVKSSSDPVDHLQNENLKRVFLAARSGERQELYLLKIYARSGNPVAEKYYGLYWQDTGKLEKAKYWYEKASAHKSDTWSLANLIRKI